MSRFVRIVATFVASVTLLPVPRAFAAEDTDLQSLRAQVQALEQQLRALSRKIELKEAAAAASAPAAKVAVTDKAVTLSSADAANEIRLRGILQVDGRVFFDGRSDLVNNALVLRRARVITEGVFARNYSYQFVTDFGGSGVSIFDANLSVNVTDWLQVKAGKFKVPVGLEQLQGDMWTTFNERSLVTNLVPNRDLGLQVGGNLFGGRLNYAAGVFNGVADAANSPNADFDNEKDFVGRVMASPLRGISESRLKGLTLGVAGSYGRQKGSAGRTSGYRTDGQQTFFSYLAPVVADGPTWRIVPQFDYRSGPLGLLGEYAISTVNLRPSAIAPRTELRNKAWQTTVCFVLTGENSAYNVVVPRTNFDLAAGTWGAFELTGRYAQMDIADAAFPAFASAAASADAARAVAVGLNWYLSKSTSLKMDFYRTRFGFSPLAPSIPASPVIRQDEKAFITRFQLGF